VVDVAIERLAQSIDKFCHVQVSLRGSSEYLALAWRGVQVGHYQLELARDNQTLYRVTQPWTDPPQLGVLVHVYVKDGSAFDLSGVIRMNCNPQPRVQVMVVVPAGDETVMSKSACGG
jgi:hypothetical protein